MHSYLHQDINWNNCALKAMRLQTSITVIFFPFVFPHSKCSLDSSSSASLLNVDRPQFSTLNPLFLLIFIILIVSSLPSLLYFSTSHPSSELWAHIFYLLYQSHHASMPMPRSPVTLASVMGTSLHQQCSCLSEKRGHQPEFFPPSHPLSHQMLWIVLSKCFSNLAISVVLLFSLTAANQHSPCYLGYS